MLLLLLQPLRTTTARPVANPMHVTSRSSQLTLMLLFHSNGQWPRRRTIVAEGLLLQKSAARRSAHNLRVLNHVFSWIAFSLQSQLQRPCHTTPNVVRLVLFSRLCAQIATLLHHVTHVSIMQCDSSDPFTHS
jgi:hypothetical protein